jgi:hypothetical protein
MPNIPVRSHDENISVNGQVFSIAATNIETHSPGWQTTQKLVDHGPRLEFVISGGSI